MKNIKIQYQKAIEFIESLINLSDNKQPSFQTAQKNFNNCQQLFKLLGHPEKNFKIIHITGTGGKGSTCELIQNILYKSGYKTGLYTSPHPTTTIERVKINAQYISPVDFVNIFNELKPVWQRMTQTNNPPTYFDALFSIAMVYFAKQKCDFIVVEAGIGARFDSTNISRNTLISAITNIGFDHMEYLGNTLKKICIEKAEIIKKNSVFFTTETRPRLKKIILQKCLAQKTKFNFIDSNSKEFAKLADSNPCINVSNIALAYKITKHLNATDAVIYDCIKNFRLPCRFEIMQNNPKVILDGAHNPDKIKSLIENLKKEKYYKLYLVCGFAKNKDVKNSLKHLLGFADQVFATRFLLASRKSFPLFDLKKIVSQKRKPCEIFIDPFEALNTAIKKAGPKDLVLVTGSFYLCGLLRTKWISEQHILNKRESF